MSMSEDDYIFYAFTPDGYIIKVLVEVLQNCLTAEAHFNFEKTGVSLCMTDEHNKILVMLDIPIANFDSPYICKKNSSLAVDLKQFHKLLKNVKKKDSLALFLIPSRVNNLGIKIIPNVGQNNSQMIEKNFIGIKTITKQITKIPKGYRIPIVIPSSVYQKMCKKIATVSGSKNNTSIVVQKNNFISFNCYAEGLSAVEIEYGSYNSEEEDVVYKGNFSNSMLLSLQKIPGLSERTKISAPKDPGYPIKFTIAVGSIGTMEIFVKTAEQIQYEENLKEKKKTDK